MRHSRPAARSRTLATKRVSVVTPGNRTFCLTSRAVAKSNSAIGRSASQKAGGQNLKQVSPRFYEDVG
jgi:hypothetical protein